MTLLQIENLSITYGTARGIAAAVRNVSLSVARNETLGIVGESGSGKSTLAHAVIGYLAPSARRTGGSVLLDGQNLFEVSQPALAKLRGRRIAMVHQNPHTTLNPALRIGTQLAESMHYHLGLSWSEARREATKYLDMVNLPDPESVAKRLPRELSGGQRQRVAIALALCVEPDLIILDEPTTNLDVTTEAVVLDLLADIKRKVSAGILYVSHNLGVVARIADRVAVMYAGEVLEQAPAQELFGSPGHPYTRALLRCIPDPGLHKRTGILRSIPGQVPKLTSLPPGCSFSTRCAHADESCDVHSPLREVELNHYVRCARFEAIGMENPEAGPAAAIDGAGGTGGELLQVHGLRKSYLVDTSGGFGLGTRLTAVSGVDLKLDADTILGLVGESGSGKTSLLRCIAGLETSDEGTIKLEAGNLGSTAESRSASTLRKVQVVFQDPESTLNPKYTIGRNLTRHIKRLSGGDRSAAMTPEEALRWVGLSEDYVARYPQELSGGENQRVAIARALLCRPSLVLCDEPVSALDVSVQASIIQLLIKLQRETKVSLLLISHDLAVVRYIADVIAVMYLGRIVEIGPVAAFGCRPVHPYSEALLSAQSSLELDSEKQALHLEGTIPSPLNPPKGCVFHTRCPRKLGEVCETTPPQWQNAGDSHRYQCHIRPADLAGLQKSSDPVNSTRTSVIKSKVGV